VLNITDDAPVLLLSDANAKSSAILGVAKGEPELRLFDENGKAGALLKMSKLGPALLLADENEKIRATLGVLSIDNKSMPRLHLSDANGKTIWSAPP